MLRHSVENMSPASFIEGLTPRVHAALPLLVDSVLAELVRLGVQFHNADGTSFVPPSPSDAERVDGYRDNRTREACRFRIFDP